MCGANQINKGTARSLREVCVVGRMHPQGTVGSSRVFPFRITIYTNICQLNSNRVLYKNSFL